MAVMESAILPVCPSPTRSMLTGSFMYCFTNFFTHLGTVAENIIVWRSCRQRVEGRVGGGKEGGGEGGQQGGCGSRMLCRCGLGASLLAGGGRLQAQHCWRQPSRSAAAAGTCLGHILQDGLHILLKANVKHLVGLIQHNKAHLQAGEGGKEGGRCVVVSRE